MMEGVRILAMLAALGMIAVPAHAQVDPDELEGSYTVDAARAVSPSCQLVERGATIRVTNVGDSSLRMVAGEPVTLSFDSSTGSVSMASEDLKIDGRFQRLRNEVRLNFSMRTAPPLDCTISVEASKPAAAALEVSPQSAADATGAATGNVEATPSPTAVATGAEPTDEEVRKSLWGDNTTLLVIAFLVLLIGSAAVTLRNEGRLRLKGDATAKTRQNHGAKVTECHRLYAELRDKRARLYSRQMAPLYPQSMLDKAEAEIARWKGLRERLLAGETDRDPGPLIRELGLEGQNAKDFRYSPAAYAQQAIERNQGILRDASRDREGTSDLGDEIEWLENERKRLGCEQLEHEHPPPA